VLNVCLTGGELPYIFIVHIDRQVSFSPLWAPSRVYGVLLPHLLGHFLFPPRTLGLALGFQNYSPVPSSWQFPSLSSGLIQTWGSSINLSCGGPGQFLVLWNNPHHTPSSQDHEGERRADGWVPTAPWLLCSVGVDSFATPSATPCRVTLLSQAPGTYCHTGSLSNPGNVCCGIDRHPLLC
jgi:hypothetical protein